MIETKIALTVHTEGIDNRIRRLLTISAIVEKYTEIAVEIAKKNARVNTGAMRDSIHAKVKQLADSIEWEISVGEGLPDGRARANEFGTSRMTAQPMIRPALEAIRDPMIAEIRAAVRG